MWHNDIVIINVPHVRLLLESIVGQVVVRGVMRHAVLKAERVVVMGRFHGIVEASTLEARLLVYFGDA